MNPDEELAAILRARTEELELVIHQRDALRGEVTRLRESQQVDRELLETLAEAFKRREAKLMGAYAQEELRRAAYPVANAADGGYSMDPGLAEMIQRLADVLSATNGWRPDDSSR